MHVSTWVEVDTMLLRIDRYSKMTSPPPFVAPTRGDQGHVEDPHKFQGERHLPFTAFGNLTLPASHHLVDLTSVAASIRAEVNLPSRLRLNGVKNPDL
jgi:hypothetical protein